MRTFVDANIPVYAVGAPHVYRTRCAEILAEGPLYPGSLVTDAGALQELLHLYLRREGTAYARETVAYFRTAISDNVAEVTLADIDFAAAMDVAARVDTWDRVHAGVMKRLGLTSIISTDRAFDLVPGIRRLDPLNFDQWRDEVFGDS